MKFSFCQISPFLIFSVLEKDTYYLHSCPSQTLGLFFHSSLIPFTQQKQSFHLWALRNQFVSIPIATFYPRFYQARVKFYSSNQSCHFLLHTQSAQWLCINFRRMYKFFMILFRFSKTGTLLIYDAPWYATVIFLTLKSQLLIYRTSFSFFRASSYISQDYWTCYTLPESFLRSLKCHFLELYSLLYASITMPHDTQYLTLCNTHNLLYCLLYYFPRSAVTNYFKLDGLKNRNVFFHSSEQYKSEIKMSAGPCDLWRFERQIFSCFFLVSSGC